MNIHKAMELFRRYGLTPNDMGRICGISTSQMRQYELGIRNPGPNTIRKINEGLDGFATSVKAITADAL